MPFKDPAKARAKAREYTATYRQRRKDSSQYLAWRKKECIRLREWNARRREGLIGRPRPSSCDACGGNEGGIVFDHCHARGHARGWLCSSCNLALGMLKDDANRLRQLIAYLKRTKDGRDDQLALAGV